MKAEKNDPGKDQKRAPWTDQAKESGRAEDVSRKKEVLKTALENIFVVVLAFYPLRHFNWGLDLMDTGYNYANFQYMGTDHMDPMWLYSTYLSNVVGHFLAGLPNGGTLLGMNLYTGLFVSLAALAGFFFCTRVLKIPAWIGFLGEMTALSLCWCPTAKLYDYLTYVLLTFCAILLYLGLIRERKWCLFGAGICLGANVLVRFSNLPEAALILAVWAYDVILEWQIRKSDVKKPPESFWKRTGRHTLWCLLGYLAALAVLFTDIHARYGIQNYAAGIGQLFAMTDNASDYKAGAMLYSLFYTYVEYLYWVVRICVILAAATVVFSVAGWILNRLCRRSGAQRPGVRKVLGAFGHAAAGVLGAAILCWLYFRRFCTLEFYSYASIYGPGILFLMLTMFLAAVRILHPKAPIGEKLISGIVLLLALLTSIGSNNGIYPSLNNLFLAAPFVFWQCWRFVGNVRKGGFGKLVFSVLPAKGLLLAFLLMCLFQFGSFGAVFVFAEATGVREAESHVENNEVLKGIRMSEDKARWLTEASAWIEEQDMQGREAILYGDIPALSYYLQLPAAFNPWCSLDSYSRARMEKSMESVELAVKKEESTAPLVIVENTYLLCRQEGPDALEALGLPQDRIKKIEQDEKWRLLADFLEKYGYEPALENEKFTVYSPRDQGDR